MFVFLNGKFEDAKRAAVSVADNGFLYGDGVYETLRTYGGKVWQVDEHLRRLRSSAALMKITVPWSDTRMKGWLDRLCAFNGFEESRIRITVTRGVNGMDFNDCKKPTLLMQAVELKEVPRALKMKGVDAVTVRFGRLLPEAKTISLLPMILAKRAAEEAGAYEAVFVDGKGCVLEGTVTNVFIVKKGVLYTAGKGVLPGTTAKALIKAARSAGMKVVRGAVKLAALKNADEVFLTNAPRGIVPVKRVDGKRVGTGKTGSVTKKLMLIFEAYICRNI